MSSPSKKIFHKLIKRSKEQLQVNQDVKFLSPKKTRQFKKTNSKTNLLKNNVEKTEILSPLFPSKNITKSLNQIESSSSIVSNNLLHSTDNLESSNLKAENDNAAINVNEKKIDTKVKTNRLKKLPNYKEASTTDDDEEFKNKSKIKRKHIKPEFEDDNKLKLAGTKRKLYPQNDKIEMKKVEATKIKEETEIKWEPKNWNIMLENIRFMRNEISAPVDTMGCDKCADEEADQKTQRFHTLVALMLSSQTKDEVTFNAMKRLKANTLTPELIVNMEAEKLQELLYPVSFYKNKTKHIQNTSKILIEKYDSDIPPTVDELIKLPGVGPKMAHICMKSAWNIVSGIGVDVHVHRISNRLNWVMKPTKTPEETRIALESWLPLDLWSEVNNLLVGFGQTICTPVAPKCDKCINNKICPSAFKIKKKNDK